MADIITPEFIGAYNALADLSFRPQTAIIDALFGERYFSPDSTSTVTFDLTRTRRRYVARPSSYASTVPPRERDGFDSITIATQFHKDAFVITAFDAKKPLVGEDSYRNPLSPADRVIALAMQDVARADDSINRAKLKMLAQVLRTGNYAVAGSAYMPNTTNLLPASRDAGNSLSAALVWSNSASKPLEDMSAAASQINTVCRLVDGFAPKDYIMSPTAYNNFIKNADVASKLKSVMEFESFLALARQQTTSVETINPFMPTGNQRGQGFFKVPFADGSMNIWVWNDWYFDESTGTEVRYIADNEVFVIDRNMLQGIQVYSEVDNAWMSEAARRLGLSEDVTRMVTGNGRYITTGLMSANGLAGTIRTDAMSSFALVPVVQNATAVITVA